MKFTTLILSLLISSLTLQSCRESSPEVVEEFDNPHEVLLQDYQLAQQAFKTLIPTISDADSFDKSLPKLNQIVSDFDTLAKNLQGLPIPDKQLQQHIRSKIEESNKLNEPTVGDMINFLGIEEREDEVKQWMNSFIDSGQRVGTEFKRLYPKEEKQQAK